MMAAPAPACDPYPSRRSDRPARIPRREAVCHGGTDAAGPCSAGDLDRFDREGFLIAEGLFSEAEIALLHADLGRLAGSLPHEDDRLVREPDNDGVLRSLFAFHDLDGPLARLAHDQRLVDRARQILDSEVYVHQSRVNRKPAFDGREFWWHSDFETWHVEDGMPAMRAVSACVFLNVNDAANGALMLIPGSHRHFLACVGGTPREHYRQSLRRQQYGIPDRQAIATLAEEGGGYRLASGRAGDVVFFDCNTLHGSAGNLTHLPRTNAFVVYNSVANRCGAPTSGLPPRPAFIGTRDHVDPIRPQPGPLTESP